MRPKPKMNPLDKRIKPNPKYSKVEPTINTGNNLRKELERLEEVQLFYKFRNDEIFRRINVNNLVRLLVEVMKLEYQLTPFNANIEEEVIPDDSASVVAFNGGQEEQVDRISELEEEEETEDIGSLIQSQFQPSKTRRSRVGTARSATSVPQGVGELDSTQDGQDVQQAEPQRPFLFLDVREGEQYLNSHLVLAESYPFARLNRCYDYELPCMIRLKNKPRAVIVVYDDDESIASKAATTLTQRGYDNVFMLSGGLRVASRKFPESLVTSGEPSNKRLEEGEVIVLERLLEENIMAGSSSRLSRSSSLSAMARSVSMENFRSSSFEGPMRTSTARRNHY